jgi:hypothetical protein
MGKFGSNLRKFDGTEIDDESLEISGRKLREDVPKWR